MNRLEIISKFFLALASSVVLLMSGVAVPPAGMILVPLVPQPVLSFGLKYGQGWSVTLLTTGIVLLGLFAGKELAFLYALFALMVILMFLLLGRVRSIELVVVSVAAAMFAVIGAVMIYFYSSWSHMAQDLRGILEGNLNRTVRLYETLGFSQESLELLRERTPQIIETVLEIMPSLLIVALGLIVLINLFFLHRRFPERRAAWWSNENLREWKGPESLVWCLIVCGFALFIPGVPVLKTVALNVLLVVAVFYFFQGLAIVAYYFHQKNVPFYLRGITYVLILFEQIFTMLVVGLGLFDLWGDFRRLKKKNLSPSQAS